MLWDCRDNSAKSLSVACDHRRLHLTELDAMSQSMFIDFARFRAQHSIVHSDDRQMAHRDNSATSLFIACDPRRLHLTELDLSQSTFIEFARFRAQHSIINSDHLSVVQLDLAPGLQQMLTILFSLAQLTPVLQSALATLF